VEGGTERHSWQENSMFVLWNTTPSDGAAVTASMSINGMEILNKFNEKARDQNTGQNHYS
jgi:hypothetical protein